VRQYEVCEGLLRRELGLELEAETQGLYERIVTAPRLAPATGARFAVDSQVDDFEDASARLAQSPAHVPDATRHRLGTLAPPITGEQQADELDPRAVQAGDLHVLAVQEMAREMRRQVAQGRTLLRRAVGETREAIEDFRKALESRPPGGFAVEESR